MGLFHGKCQVYYFRVNCLSLVLSPSPGLHMKLVQFKHVSLTYRRVCLRRVGLRRVGLSGWETPTVIVTVGALAQTIGRQVGPPVSTAPAAGLFATYNVSHDVNAIPTKRFSGYRI